MATVGTVQIRVTEVPELKAFFVKLGEVLNAHPNNVVTKEVLSVIDECWPGAEQTP